MADEQDSYMVEVTQTQDDGTELKATAFINPNTGSDSQIGDFEIPDSMIAEFKTLLDIKDMDGEEIAVPTID